MSARACVPEFYFKLYRHESIDSLYCCLCSDLQIFHSFTIFIMSTERVKLLVRPKIISLLFDINHIFCFSNKQCEIIINDTIIAFEMSDCDYFVMQSQSQI